MRRNFSTLSSLKKKEDEEEEGEPSYKIHGKSLDDKDGSLSLSVNFVSKHQIRFLGGFVVKGSFLWILD